MGIALCGNSLLQCSFGLAPAPLMVVPKSMVMTGMPMANIMDNVPMMNILPFGMCTSPSNPMVIAATAAALGVPTPMPCLPVIPGPWLPGSPTVLVGNMPALQNSSKAMCAWAGIIQPVVPGQFQTMVP